MKMLSKAALPKSLRRGAAGALASMPSAQKWRRTLSIVLFLGIAACGGGGGDDQGGTTNTATGTWSTSLWGAATWGQ